MSCQAQYLNGELAEGRRVATQEQAEHQVVRTLHAIYILFIHIIVVIFLSLCYSVKLFLLQPTSFAFSC